MGYKGHVFKSISWIALLRISTRLITFVRLAILARILSPVQFGVFGIATLVLSFLEIITETGINVILVQERNEKDYIDSAWTISLIRGVIISLLIVALTPTIANFFNSKESEQLLFLIALVPLIRGLINPSIVFIQKNIEFHKEFYFRTVLFLVDATVAIISAFITKSALSFVYGLIASAVLEVILSYIFFDPRPRLSFDLSKLSYLIKKGFWVTATGIFSFLADNSDNGAVGKVLGASSLGIYQVAYKLSTLTISEIVDTVNKVVFPVYSKFSDDRRRLLIAFSKVTVTTTILALFLGSLIIIFAKELVVIVVGEKWLAAVPVIQILSAYGVLRTVFGNFSPLALSLGKQDYVAKATFVRCVALLLIVFPLTINYGLIGAGFAMLFSILLEIPLISYYTLKILRNG